MYNVFSRCYWDFLVLGVLLVGAVNTSLHIIYLILYMICLSLKYTNVFSGGLTLECLLINIRDETMSNKSLEQQEYL